MERLDPRTASVDEAVEQVLTTTSTWAVVGCSPRPGRDSNRVASRLLDWGFEAVPVNPAADEVLGRQAWPSLAEVPPEVQIDVVDIFRRSDQAGRHVDEAIERGADAVWLQLGVVDQAAAQRARQAGLWVVMDRCPLIEYPALRRAS